MYCSEFCSYPTWTHHYTVGVHLSSCMRDDQMKPIQVALLKWMRTYIPRCKWINPGNISGSQNATVFVRRSHCRHSDTYSTVWEVSRYHPQRRTLVVPWTKKQPKSLRRKQPKFLRRNFGCSFLKHSHPIRHLPSTHICHQTLPTFYHECRLVDILLLLGTESQHASWP